ncbi:hypothetical protein AVEN_147942-1 [Araneus ventricosus]|uniref:Uncharacterized protein n=1 Tax=Araneus ventricosus TaxID=182803 RepID=A0A4Y2U2W4_ARAVE|nr:hypothetical protein AVEN_147942-1 [Araneus ventricosus]
MKFSDCQTTDFNDGLRIPPVWRHRLPRRLANAATVTAPTSTTTCKCRHCDGTDFYDDLRMPPLWRTDFHDDLRMLPLWRHGPQRFASEVPNLWHGYPWGYAKDQLEERQGPVGGNAGSDQPVENASRPPVGCTRRTNWGGRQGPVREREGPVEKRQGPVGEREGPVGGARRTSEERRATAGET